jgi:vacuolar protein sorting-associated protein 16
MVLVVGPFGDWIKYSFDGVVHLVSEVDGVRIITNDKSLLLQRVPSAFIIFHLITNHLLSFSKMIFNIAATEEVFRIGSTSPGAVLYDALEHFEVCSLFLNWEKL